MAQFNDIDDAKLNDLAAQALDAKTREKAAQTDYERAFVAAFEIFDKVVGAGKQAVFFAKNGKLLERRVTDPEPKLSVSALKEALEARGVGGRRLWNEIATPSAWTVDLDKLQKAVERRRIPAEVLSECISTPEPGVSRWLRDPAKADAVYYKVLSGADRAELPAALGEWLDIEEASA